MRGSCVDILNQIAFVFLIILVISVFIGIMLINKGQQRRRFKVELKIIVISMIVSLIAIAVLIGTSNFLA